MKIYEKYILYYYIKYVTPIIEIINYTKLLII